MDVIGGFLVTVRYFSGARLGFFFLLNKSIGLVSIARDSWDTENNAIL